MFCPLGKLEDVCKDGCDFYSIKKREEDRPTPWTGDRPTFEQLQETETGRLFEMIIDGERWRRVPLDVTWELAEDDANYPCVDPLANVRKTPRHIHCEFEFLHNVVHIDFVSFVQGGPLSGFAEFQFFLNGQFRSRGGYFACWGMFQRAMPACLRTNKFAIIAYGGFAGAVLPPYTGLSAWVIEPKS